MVALFLRTELPGFGCLGPRLRSVVVAISVSPGVLAMLPYLCWEPVYSRAAGGCCTPR